MSTYVAEIAPYLSQGHVMFLGYLEAEVRTVLTLI